MKWDKKAFAQAVGLMLMSWAALPIVYWLLVRRNNKCGRSRVNEKEVKKNGPKGNTGRNKERDT